MEMGLINYFKKKIFGKKAEPKFKNTKDTIENLDDLMELEDEDYIIEKEGNNYHVPVTEEELNQLEGIYQDEGEKETGQSSEELLNSLLEATKKADGIEKRKEETEQEKEYLIEDSDNLKEALEDEVYIIEKEGNNYHLKDTEGEKIPLSEELEERLGEVYQDEMEKETDQDEGEKETDQDTEELCNYLAEILREDNKRKEEESEQVREYSERLKAMDTGGPSRETSATTV